MGLQWRRRLQNWPRTPNAERRTLNFELATGACACAMLLQFNKPYGVLSQFRADSPNYQTLSEFGFPNNVYPIGRLDADSEGLLLLSDESGLNSRLLDPSERHEREYLAQVERIPTPEALWKLEQGVTVQGRLTLPCKVALLDPQPDIPPRIPPIRFRKNVPDCWISLCLSEGKNRQVRRMTASIGHPTLRLVRVRIAGLTMENLPPGKWTQISPERLQLRTSARGDHRRPDIF